MASVESSINLFRFLRMRSDVGEMISTTKITCAKLNENYLAVGTSTGEVVLSDLAGKIVQRWRCFSTPVNDVSFDEDGKFIGSCSNCGNVVIQDISSLENQMETHSFGEPILSICLDPAFGKKSEKRFVAGAARGHLFLTKKTWFNSKDAVIHEGEGKVTAIVWLNSLIAWSNDRGVKVIDIETEEKITFIERPGYSLNCQLFWETESSLIVSWAQTVQIVEFFSTSESILEPSSEGRRRCAQIVSSWEIEPEWEIYGLSPFDSESFVLLAFEQKPGDQISGSPMPEIQVRHRLSGELLFTPDALPLRSFDGQSGGYSLQTTCMQSSKRSQHFNWHHTDWIVEPNSESKKISVMKGDPPVLYVISSSDLVVVRVRDLDDHVNTALSERRFKDALEIAKSHPAHLKRSKVADIAALFLEDKLFNGLFEEAASACPKLFSGDAHAWEYWILKFIKCDQLWALAPYIPVSSPRLEAAVYEMVLEVFLAKSPRSLLGTLRLWGFPGRGDSALYSLPLIMKRIQSHLKDHGPDPHILQAQAYLFIMSRQYEEALETYLKLDSRSIDQEELTQIFNLIDEQALYGVIKHRIIDLIRLSREHAAELLLKATDEIPIEIVAGQLKGNAELTLWYLHQLFLRQLELYNEPQFGALHILQVQLYAEIATCVDLSSSSSDGPASPSDLNFESFLIQFLRWSWNANNNPEFFPSALDICRRQNPPLYNEMVFILGETQRSSEALRLLLDEVKDVRRAIFFVESLKDSTLTKELWGELIKFSHQHPSFLTGMLDYSSLYSVELPSRLIKEIPQKTEIDDLRLKLIRIFDDYRFQLSLQQGTREIMESWYIKERTKFKQIQRRGRRVDLSIDRPARDLGRFPRSDSVNGSWNWS